MASHSSTLAWKIPWMEEPSRLQSMGSLRVGHDWGTSLSLLTFTHWRRKWQPTPVFLSGESQGRGTWWAAVYRVTQSWTRLKWLSSSSSIDRWDDVCEKEGLRIIQSLGPKQLQILVITNWNAIQRGRNMCWEKSGIQLYISWVWDICIQLEISTRKLDIDWNSGERSRWAYKLRNLSK